MLTIITGIYAVIKYIFEYNKGIKEFWKKAGSAILCYIIGILMAGIILLPTIYAFINSTRTDSGLVSSYISGFYEFFFMGIISMRYKNWTAIGLSSLIILMIPALITKLKSKEEKSFIVLFFITTIMLLLPQVSSVMNGFSFPSNRWVFAYSFILSYIVVLGYNSKFEYSKKQKIYMLTTLIIYTIIGILVTRFKIKKNLDYYATGALAYIFLALIVFGYKKIKNKKMINNIIVFLVGLNIFIISAALYYPQGKGYVEEFIEIGTVEENCSNVNGKVENFKEAVEYIKENDKGFYRITKKHNTYENLSIIYDYNPIQLFLSLGNGNVYNLSCSIDDNCHSHTRCVNGADGRTKFTTLISTQYYICDKVDSRYVPYGYSLYYEIGNTQIYINKNYLSPGIVYENSITKEQFENLNALEKEDALLTTAMVENKGNIINSNTVTINKPVSLNYSVKENKIENNTINITKNNESITLEIEQIPNNYELYLNIENLEYITDSNKKDFKITAKKDGITNSEKLEDINSSPYYMYNPNFLMNLGITKENQESNLEITFNKKGTYTFDNIQILAVSMEEYEEKVKKINEMENVSYGNNYIAGTVNTDNAGILQITTSYSKGWRAYVNGKEVEVFKVNDAFIGINIDAGKHEIEFKYETPYLKLGIISSCLGILAYIFIKRREAHESFKNQ